MQALPLFWIMTQMTHTAARSKFRIDGSHAMRILVGLSAVMMPTLAGAAGCSEYTERLLMRLSQEVRPALTRDQFAQVTQLAHASCDETIAAASGGAVGRDSGRPLSQGPQQAAMPDFWDYLLMDTGGKRGNQRLRTLK
jgi:hypothetical protein